jgi:hypothetical protein
MTANTTCTIAKTLSSSFCITTMSALEPFIDRSYVAIWYWIQEFNPNDVFPNKKKARRDICSEYNNTKINRIIIAQSKVLVVDLIL